jgi:carboxyl-terminal processing protease
VQFSSAKDFNVDEQLRGNRYVGIGIALGSDKAGPVVSTAFPQGVAYMAGIRAEDRIVKVGDVDVQSMNLRDVVDLIRGPEGSTVSLLIDRSGKAEPLHFALRRSVVPFETVLGYAKTKEGAWDYGVQADPAVAYVQIREVRASTLHELRQIEQRLRSEGYRRLILDLRHNDGGNFHDTLLLADGLLPETVIGSVRRVRGTESFQSAPDCLFRDWPLAVLIDSNSRRAAEWLATALHDGRQAMLVGLTTPGAGYVIEPVKLPSGRGVVRLWSGVLHRADGRSLLPRNSDFFKDPHLFRAAVRAAPRHGSVSHLGVVPDVEVEIEGNWLQNWMDWRSRMQTEPVSLDPPVDPQLNRAVKELSRLMAR